MDWTLPLRTITTIMPIRKNRIIRYAAAPTNGGEISLRRHGWHTKRRRKAGSRNFLPGWTGAPDAIHIFPENIRATWLKTWTISHFPADRSSRSADWRRRSKLTAISTSVHIWLITSALPRRRTEWALSLRQIPSSAIRARCMSNLLTKAAILLRESGWMPTGWKKKSIPTKTAWRF